MPRRTQATNAEKELRASRNRVKSFKARLNEAMIMAKNVDKHRAPSRATPESSSESEYELLEPPAPRPQLRNPTPISRTPQLDITEDTYDLNIAIFVDKECVSNKTRHPKVNEFKFQPYLAETIKSVARRTENTDELVTWLYGKAEIRHKGIKKAADYFKNDIDDDMDWEDVQTTIKSWMQRNYQDIRVDLNLHFSVPMKKTNLDVEVADTNEQTKRPNNLKDKAKEKVLREYYMFSD